MIAELLEMIAARKYPVVIDDPARCAWKGCISLEWDDDDPEGNVFVADGSDMTSFMPCHVLNITISDRVAFISLRVSA